MGVSRQGSANHGSKGQGVWRGESWGGEQGLCLVLINTGSLIHRCSITICSINEWVCTHFPFLSVHSFYRSAAPTFLLPSPQSTLSKVTVTSQWNNLMDTFQSFTSWTHMSCLQLIDQLFFHLQAFLSHHVLQVLFLAFASLHRFSILCPSLVVCSRVLLEAHIFSHNTLSGDLILSLD